MAQSPQDEINLRKYIRSSLFKAEGIRETSSTGAHRYESHIRFPFMAKASFEKMKERFRSYGLQLEESTVSISDQSPTYILRVANSVLIKKIYGEPITLKNGAMIYWVNNGQKRRESQAGTHFQTKELTPANINKRLLTGRELSKGDMRAIIEASLKRKTGKKNLNELMRLLDACDTTESRISISPDFNTTDIKIVSKDFGELMSAMWIMNHGYNKVLFPPSDVQPLVDFTAYGSNGKTAKISVKSGTGSKVTITNITDSIENEAKENIDDYKRDPAFEVFDIVKNYTMKEGILELHKKMMTPSIEKLREIMKASSVDSITLQSLQNWLRDIPGKSLKIILDPFYKVNVYGVMTDKSWDSIDRDKMRAILSPLGESMVRMLNDDPKTKKILNNLANKMKVKQLDVKMLKKSITFQIRDFADMHFKFSWAGYNSGNKLGFKAEQ